MIAAPSLPKARARVGLGLRGPHVRAIAEGAAAGAVDLLELSPENWMGRGERATARLAQVAAHHPLVCHGLMLSLGGFDPWSRPYLDGLCEVLAATASPWHSDHLCWSATASGALHDLLPVPQTRAHARHVARRIRTARAALGVPIAVENVSWYARLGPAELDEADFLAEALERADAALLLDVNNLWVNARNHGFAAEDWLARVPLERVVQLHVAGHEPWSDSLIVDTHGAAVRDEVLALLRDVVERVGDVPVILERDQAIPPLPALLAELAQVREAVQAGLDARAPAAQELAPETITLATPARLEPPQPPHAPVAVAASGSDEDREGQPRIEAFAAMIRAPAPPDADAGDPSGALSRLPAEIRAQIEADQQPAERVAVYRALVHRRMVAALRGFAPRTFAALPEGTATRWIGAFLAAGGPRARRFRDVPVEAVRWALVDPAVARLVPRWAVEAAAVEVLERAVTDRPPPGPAGGPLALDAGLGFDTTVELLAVEHDVLPWLAQPREGAERRDPTDTLPDARARVPAGSGLLGYVERSGTKPAVRWLRLTPDATTLTRALLGGTTVERAIREMAGVAAGPLPDAPLVLATRLLADFSERGITRGARAPKSPG
jgi:uncharacterized protein (UPF0276 family)